MPQVNPTTSAPKIVTNPTRMGWRNITLGIFIGATIIGGALVSFYYFELKNLSSSENPQVTVTKPNNTTESAAPKPEQPKVVPDETADWKTYSDTKLRFEIKYPISWKINVKDTPSASPSEPGKKYRTVTLKKGEEEMDILEGGGIGFGGESSVESLTVGSRAYEFYFYAFSDEQYAYMSKDNVLSPKDITLGFFIKLNKKNHETSIAEIKNMLATFKFLD